MAVSLPEDLKPFHGLAQILLKEEGVKAIEFSGGTYQIQVGDPVLKEPIWAFLQFDEKGRLKDRFCSCEGGEDVTSCIHLAVAFLAIFGKHDSPLHLRFERSLWYSLGQVAYQQWGEPEQKGGKIRVGREFFAEAKTEKGKKELREIFVERHPETEETSLKFSNLPVEEIIRWKEGRPSPKLRFELSSWNDLAKWMMLKQERESPYQIDFKYGKEGFPQTIHLEFDEAIFKFFIKNENWPTLIPTLATLHSPLRVHLQEEGIKNIWYEKAARTFRIEPLEPIGEKLPEGRVLGEWAFLPKEGFYPTQPHPLLRRPHSVAEVLMRYPDLVKEKLRGVSTWPRPVPVSYQIAFDQSWNLSVEGYLFEPGDLSRPSSAFFGKWAYIEEKGFCQLEGNVFDSVQFMVPEARVAEFIRNYRVWLDRQPGFQTHLSGVETVVTYTVTSSGRLQFSKRAAVEEGGGKEFGPWFYLPKQGFFPKISASVHFPIHDVLSLGPDQIPLFIRANQEELGGIKGFFSHECPVEKMGLRIGFQNGDSLIISPEYRLLPSYKEKPVQFFEEYVYVEGEGFSVIPPPLRLPSRFFHSVHLTQNHFVPFFSRELDRLKEFILSIDPRLERPGSIELVMKSIEKEQGRYLLRAHYQTEKGVISLEEVQNGKKRGARYLFSKGGRIDLEEERFQWMRGEEQWVGNRLSVSSLELLRLLAFDTPRVEEGAETITDLLTLKSDDEPDLSLLKSPLRPYQILGVKWLWFLYRHHLSGLLCDDMGLGKTHQAMALMAAVSKQQSKKKFLVICPTSVIYHWEDKLREYLPDIPVRIFHGTGRVLDDFDEGILLTSYGIWRKEAHSLTKIPFEIAIFDEIQAAKNQKSRIHTSIQKVSASVKIGLTGTPIENRLRELKALFDLILPGLMPSENRFRDDFIIPIEKENSSKQKALLSRFIKPFMLRRRKEEVLLDLPEKTEEIAHCELTLDQRLLYTDLLNKVKEGIIRQLADHSAPIPFLHIFTVLSSLKQICNHPASYLKIPDAYGDYHSGKWDLFIELVNEALESGQKVVVFSHFLAMLDIMELYFKENQIGFAGIRGDTLKRGEEVRRFNQDPSCRVFLGSLHAAGLGIDLTGASVVIHYDRWWNAARENQATDRVHRIGQTRGVQVFKLVTKGTFEEKIDEMILRKGELMEEVVGVDDHRFMKHFDREELIQLLSTLP